MHSITNYSDRNMWLGFLTLIVLRLLQLNHWICKISARTEGLWMTQKYPRLSTLQSGSRRLEPEADVPPLALPCCNNVFVVMEDVWVGVVLLSVDGTCPVPRWPLHLDIWDHAVDQKSPVNATIHDLNVHGQNVALLSIHAVSLRDVLLHERPQFNLSVKHALPVETNSW